MKHGILVDWLDGGYNEVFVLNHNCSANNSPSDYDVNFCVLPFGCC